MNEFLEGMALKERQQQRSKLTFWFLHKTHCSAFLPCEQLHVQSLVYSVNQTCEDNNCKLHQDVEAFSFFFFKKKKETKHVYSETVEHITVCF